MIDRLIDGSTADPWPWRCKAPGIMPVLKAALSCVEDAYTHGFLGRRCTSTGSHTPRAAPVRRPDGPIMMVAAGRAPLP
jgi:hypothetical protein